MDGSDQDIPKEIFYAAKRDAPISAIAPHPSGNLLNNIDV
jgi:hypothetical protein